MPISVRIILREEKFEKLPHPQFLFDKGSFASLTFDTNSHDKKKLVFISKPRTFICK